MTIVTTKFRSIHIADLKQPERHSQQDSLFGRQEPVRERGMRHREKASKQKIEKLNQLGNTLTAIAPSMDMHERLFRMHALPQLTLGIEHSKAGSRGAFQGCNAVETSD